MFLAFSVLRAVILFYACTYVRTVHAKKLAKVLLFFELTKYFRKKNQKKCILHDLHVILAI